MNIRLTTAVLAAAAILLGTSAARAQMFGTRAVGAPVSQRVEQKSVPSASSESGLDQARFLRKNRSAGSFVGTDANDASHFVGAEEKASAVQSAIDNLRSLRAKASSNRQLQSGLATPARKLPIYPLELQVGFAYTTPSSTQVTSTLVKRLQACPGLHASGPIEVSLAGRTATIRGTVAAESDRLLAQQLLLFEPGISNVANELKIQAAASTPASAPQTPAPTSQP